MLGLRSDIQELLFYIIIPIVGFIIISVLCIYFGYRSFALNRRNFTGILIPIKYIPARIKRKIEVIDFRSPLTKRQKRKHRIKKHEERLRSKQVKPIFEESKQYNNDEDIELGNQAEDGMNDPDGVEGDGHEEGAEDDEEDDIVGGGRGRAHPSRRISGLSSAFFRSSFFKLPQSFLLSGTTTGSTKVPSSSTKLSFAGSARLTSTKQRGGNNSRASSNNIAGNSIRSSFDGASSNKSNSKRFISQDRVDRAEARKQRLLRASMPNFSEMLNEDDDEDILDGDIPILSILDEEKRREEKMQMIVARRRRLREERYAAAASSSSPTPGHSNTNKPQLNEQTAVLLNSGPPLDQIPAGFTMIEFPVDLLPEHLLYKRILYKWEVKNRPMGWFIATIVSESKAPNCNYNIKYDRAETGTLFIDGMHTVLLSFSGEQAYGRRWVIIERADGKRGMEKATPTIIAATKNNNQPQSPPLPSQPLQREQLEQQLASPEEDS